LLDHNSMIQAIIFDMDGLLVDSEPWWRVAENKVFGRLSVAPTEEEFEAMMGNRIQEVIAKWHAKYPWDNFDLKTTQDEIISEVATLVTRHSDLLPGVTDTLGFFRRKQIPMVVASSSPLLLIENLISHYDIANYFGSLHSAEFEAQGKPAPDVFLAAARYLNIDAKKCLVFEDSYNGVLAAKAAGMKCVAVPAAEHFNQERFDIADIKLSSLTHWNEEVWHRIATKSKE
jgi:HAD superfamily hydrolase (TIGR01509 family)